MPSAFATVTSPVSAGPPDTASCCAAIRDRCGASAWLNADAAENGMLVFSEVYYPGWQAAIDGAPARLLRADGILMALALPKGRHAVELILAIYKSAETGKPVAIKMFPDF